MPLEIASILFTGEPRIDLAGLQGNLARLFPALPPSSDGNHDAQTFSFSIGDAEIIMGLMPVPYPWSDLEGPCETSLLWRDAEKEVRTHTHHMIVTVCAELDPLPISKLLSQVCASVLVSSRQGIGVYWGNATLLIPKTIFLEVSQATLSSAGMEEEWPITLWVDFRVGMQDENLCSGFTCGLKSLGFMEIETMDCSEPPEKLYERLYSLAESIVSSGKTILDGDTVGNNTTGVLRIRHQKSSFGHEGKVLRLIYGNGPSKKPWWKVW